MATLIGAGGHAEDIAATRAFDRQIPHHFEWTDDGLTVTIGISNPQTRAAVAAELGVTDDRWVHPHTWIGHNCHWGYGTHINYAVTMTRTTLGHHCTISPGVTLCGDITIGNRVLIGAGATICEKVVIEDDVTIGAGAVILPGHWEIPPDGEQPGVPVYRRIPAGTLWTGVPATQR